MARRSKQEAAETRAAIIGAARRVFHQWGVSRATLEKVAAEAGVTRGAVYHHFGSKTALFLAAQEGVLVCVIDTVDQAIMAAQADPLAAIKAALHRLFRLLSESAIVRELLEIVIGKCENTEEFADMQGIAADLGRELFKRITALYLECAEKGILRKGLDPIAAARDTWAFSQGLLYLLAATPHADELRKHIPAMIHVHMDLR